MEIIYKKTSELIPYANNSRTHSDEQIKQICASINEYGFTNPILIDEKNMIIAGHGRVLASEKLKLDEVPCIVLEGLTEAQKKAYIIADNKMALNAGWNEELLKIELENLKELDFDLSLTGFDVDELDDILGVDESNVEVEEDDYQVELPVEPKTKLGEIYQLGDHRLMVGDSTNEDDVKELMNEEIADLLFTDPPYNINVSNSDGMTIENDNMDDESFKLFLNSAFKCASQSLKPGGAFYIWYADGEAVNFRTQCEENELSIKQNLIWVKNSFNFGRQDYKWKHEPCLYGWKDGASHYFVDEYNHPTVIEDEIDLDKLKKEDMKRMLEEILSSNVATTIIHEDKPLKNDLHPTMKPLKMCGELIRHSSKPKELVLDLFGGSGSTLVTCEQLGRKCYMMEYDPQYADVIIDRWEQLTGKKAVKIK